jgi:Tfp pilus assembly protein PilF
MQIIHIIDDFFFIIFPDAVKDDSASIIKAVREFYTIGTEVPTVSIQDGLVLIDLPESAQAIRQKEFDMAVKLCEAGKYAEAKPILLQLIEKDPTHSEYHRIMGQVLYDEGDQEEAVNYLIDALRWDAKNGHALLMMGNIFTKFKKDIATALKYYEQALLVNPEDYITINNIGYSLMTNGQPEEARKYFEKVLAINSDFANAHLALGLLADQASDDAACFAHCVTAIQLSPADNQLKKKAIELAFKSATNIVQADNGFALFKTYLAKLEYESEKSVKIIEEQNIPSAAKLEIAEHHKRSEHLLKYKPDFPAVAHLIMHELVHLDFVLQARQVNANSLFVSNAVNKAAFMKRISDTVRNLIKMRLPENVIEEFCTSIFHGINSQIFNTPIDLFIEDFLYKSYESLRPYQFLSLHNLIRQGITGVTDKKILELSPKEIVSTSKVYNLVLAIQYKNLYGIDLIKEFNASAKELKTAQEFYNEYLEYQNDREPAEEYELIQHWAEDLNLQDNFSLMSESEYLGNDNDVEQLLKAIKEDPYGVEMDDPVREENMAKFLEAQEQKGVKSEVIMYMVGALEFFKNMPQEKIKAIAFEIAQQGIHGYSVDRDDYRISSIPGKKFSGYHILSYYYVSWALSMPDMLAKLQLPFDDEYALAHKLFRGGK